MKTINELIAKLKEQEAIHGSDCIIGIKDADTYWPMYVDGFEKRGNVLLLDPAGYGGIIPKEIVGE